MEYRTYISLATARKAIKARQLDGEPVRYDSVLVDGHTQRRIMPVVLVRNESDRREVEELGFKAEHSTSVYRRGSTVALHPSIAASRHNELAVVTALPQDTVSGGIKLDRPLGGTTFWDIEDLVLV